jgi:transposase
MISIGIWYDTYALAAPILPGISEAALNALTPEGYYLVKLDFSILIIIFLCKKSSEQRKDMNKKYIVNLTDEEREYLNGLVTKGKASAHVIRHANILLKADADSCAWPDEQIAEAFSAHKNTVVGIRQRFVEDGLETALGRKKQSAPSHKKILDGEGEARLIAMSCSEPPEGYSRWTLRLLADKAVDLEIAGSISYETVRQTLKKMS